MWQAAGYFAQLCADKSGGWLYRDEGSASILLFTPGFK